MDQGGFEPGKGGGSIQPLTLLTQAETSATASFRDDWEDVKKSRSDTATPR